MMFYTKKCKLFTIIYLNGKTTTLFVITFTNTAELSHNCAHKSGMAVAGWQTSVSMKEN